MLPLETRLLSVGALTPEALNRARDIARRSGKPLAETLISHRFADEATVLAEWAREQGLTLVDLVETPCAADAVRALPAKLAAHYTVLPVRLADGILTIAVADASAMSAVEDIETNLGLRVERVLARRADIEEGLRRHYGVGADTVERIFKEEAEPAQVITLDESHDLGNQAEDASVIHLVNQIFQDAIACRATDIHLEIGRDDVSIRRRVDGMLQDAQLPRDLRRLYPAMVSRIKLMSGLNIVERRLPQDGRARVRFEGDNYDIRVSVVPAVHGEDIVARILPARMLFDLEQLGFSRDHLETIQGLIANPHGILFVTGPTGSGKSTTLYACLSRLNSRTRKIVTIEDPVEYELSGITQTQVNPQIGLTFAHALRSMLRHDPDVMMVGEVRDRETADIAIQTAMTGHLVLSTLHTNDAAGSAVRLVDMGIDPYLVTSTVLAFAAQRLVRVICPACREAYRQEDQERYRGRGCRQCGGSGYRGRVAICEILLLSPPVQQLILERAPAPRIQERAVAAGMVTLAEDGWRKVSTGVTTAEEVLRVTRA
jgi:type II secretory ATPase GspE/PulE/Tfp pilus assembly ATPase PilB-like protein